LALALALLGPAVPASPGDSGCAWIYGEVGKPLKEPSPPNAELCRKGYILSFNRETGIADWVMERLTAPLLGGDADRKNSRYKADPEIEKSPSLADYRDSGYDRGHLAPAADMKWSQQAMDESFYLSNIAPQIGPGFNRGIWAILEADIRTWARNKGDLIVITGPVYYDYQPVIGKIVVPDAFYKIIYAPNQGQALAFLLPNRALNPSALDPYQVTIDALEAITGYDFFASLPQATETPLELSAPPVWKLLL